MSEMYRLDAVTQDQDGTLTLHFEDGWSCTSKASTALLLMVGYELAEMVIADPRSNDGLLAKAREFMRVAKGE